MESKLLWFITENAVNMFESIMLFSFIGALFKEKYRFKPIYVILIFAFGLSISLMNILNLSSNINFILIIFMAIVISIIFYKGTSLNKILAIILFLAIWFISEVAVVMLLITALHIDIQLIYDQSIYRLESIFLAKIVLFIIIKIIERFKKNTNAQKIPTYYWIFLLLIPISSSISMFAIFSVIKNFSLILVNPYMISFSFVGLLFTNVIVFYLFENIISHEELKYKFGLTQKQIEIQGKHYNEIEENHKDIRNTWHDIKHHIICLKAMISNNDIIEVEKYLSGLEKATDGLIMPALSGHKTIDAVLGQKYLVSKRNGIELNFNICLNAFIRIESQDLCALLSNALDNAIEACEELSFSKIKKVINVNISSERSFFKVRVINPIIEKPVMVNNSYITKKNNSKNHGIGLKSIGKIVDKYSGELIINTKNNEFDLLAIMNMI